MGNRSVTRASKDVVLGVGSPDLQTSTEHKRETGLVNANSGLLRAVFMSAAGWSPWLRTDYVFAVIQLLQEHSLDL